VSQSKVSDGNITPDEWFNHFQNLSKPPADVTKESEIMDEIDDMESIPIFNQLDYSITQEEIRQAIGKLKNGKVAGLDSITNEMIKAGVNELIVPLTALFNNILSTGEYPEAWREGYITPIHKKGCSSDPGNYRGITINSCLAKVFSSVLNNRLDTFIVDNQILHDTQIGFKKGSRTSDHLFVLDTLVDKYVRKSTGDNSKLFVCFVDFKTAYDSVWRNGLLHRLLSYGVGSKFYQVLTSMYTSVKTCVKTKDGFTQDFNSHIGLKQGDILSPLLFNLYINELSGHLITNADTPTLNGVHVNHLLYADDLVLISRSRAGLQQQLDSLNSFSEKWQLQINYDKTKVLVFNKSGKRCTDHFHIGNTSVNCCTQYTYLGVDITSSGTYTAAKTSLSKKGLKALFALRKTINGLDLQPHVGLQLFDQLIKPVMLYGSEIWGYFSITSAVYRRDPDRYLENIFEDLPGERVCMSFAKQMLGVNHKASNCAVRGELGLYPLYIDVLAGMCTYWNRLRSMPDTSLLNAALQENDNIGGKWTTCVRTVVDKCNLEYQPNSLIDKVYVKSKLKEIYINHWTEKLWDDKRVNGGNKLRTYRQFKTSFELEPYLLHVKNCKSRKELCRFRISAHRLHIETGRYTIPITAVEDRLCGCNPGHIEDEFHVFAICPAYSAQRQTFLESVAISGPISMEVFLSLMSDIQCHVQKAVASFISTIMLIKSQVL
jgi:hypothetical protein